MHVKSLSASDGQQGVSEPVLPIRPSPDPLLTLPYLTAGSHLPNEQGVTFGVLCQAMEMK